MPDYATLRKSGWRLHLGTITTACAVCGEAFRQFRDDSTPDQTSHGICTRLACVNEWRRRLGLRPVDPTDTGSKATAAYLSAVADELSAALACSVCGSPFDPCACLPPFDLCEVN
jgi:hypothetical protein